MDKIKRLPVKYRRPSTLPARDMWAIGDIPDEMAWEVCPYAKGPVQGIDDGCQQCPKWEEDERHGQFKRGCRMLAEETCRVVLAMQRKLAEAG